MKATIITMRMPNPPPPLPQNPPRAYHEAKTENNILIVFSRPLDGSLSLSDQLDIDLEQLDREQDVTNLTTGKIVRLTIKKMDVHDLSLPMRHGRSRFPSSVRRKGAQVGIGRRILHLVMRTRS
jgi:hypothetical protein